MKTARLGMLACALFMFSLRAEAPADRRAVAEVNEIEDLSEQVANMLLDASVAVRDRDEARFFGFFANQVVLVGFPATPERRQPDVKWMDQHAWKLGPHSTVDHSALRRLWQPILNHFRSVEDARFKVVQASFASDRRSGRVQIKFFIIGASDDAQHEWLKGLADAIVVRSGHQWQIREFDLRELESKLGDEPLFTEVSRSAHVDHELPPVGERNWHPLANIYPGAAAGDLDNDGLIDLVVAGADGVFLYRNQGDGTFRDIAESVGLRPKGIVVQPLLLDYDGDGDLDIFFTVNGKQMLFENRLIPDGVLRFRDVSDRAGVAIDAPAQSAVAGDVNGDGLPDIYVCVYGRYSFAGVNSLTDATNGAPNLLFLNQGDGTFKEVAHEAGVDSTRWSFAAEIVDIDGDGKPDIFVSNDFGKNQLFLNQGSASGIPSFKEVATDLGVHGPGYGMGVSVGDYNNDGILDIHATFMSSTAGNRILGLSGAANFASPERLQMLKMMAAGNRLYAGQGNGRFRDVTDTVGPLQAQWAWGGGFIDVDNDGWLDLYTANGMISGTQMKDT